MSDPTALPIRPLVPEDLPQAHGLTAAIRWPHRLEDWQFGLALGEGFAISEAGRLLGTAMVWPFGAAHGCFGMLIVAIRNTSFVARTGFRTSASIDRPLEVTRASY